MKKRDSDSSKILHSGTSYSGIPGRLDVLGCVLLVIIPVLCMIFGLCAGRMQISAAAVIKSLAAKAGFGSGISRQQEIVLWSIRFPRLLLAALTGAGLAVSGCAFQSLFSNPLATPDTLGVASGAGFGAAVALLAGFSLIGVQLTAVTAGLAAVALTSLCGRNRSGNRITVILSGIMISSLFSSFISLVKYMADTESQLPSITYWLMGSFASAGYRQLAFGSPLIIAGTFVLWLLRWRLNVLPLGSDEAASSGVNVRVLRGVTVLCATSVTASCVSMCGQVGWIGLLIPHICRMKFGNNHIALVPACISIGAAFMILVDTAARTFSASEIPVSVLTAIAGAPFFIVLMRKNGGLNI